MPKKYSVAEARRQLPKLLHDVEGGQSVEITRRGAPVAVVMSLDEYRVLTGEGPGFGKSYAAWRRSVDDDALVIEDDFFDTLRDRTAGREVEL